MTQKQGERSPSTTQSPVIGIDCAVLEMKNTFGAGGYVRHVFLNIELEDGRSKRFNLVNFPNQPDRTPELLEQAASWMRGLET